MKHIIKLFTASATAALIAAPAWAQEEVVEVVGPNSGDTAWMLVSSLLVLMMVLPGLALFYGGLIKKNSVLATLMQTTAVLCIVSVLWPVIGYTMAFGTGTYIGDFSKIMLHGVDAKTLSGTIPETVFIVFQLTFAAITTALPLGAVADRIKFSAVCWFAPLWLLLVYAPIAHWVWGPGGFIGGVGGDGDGLLGFGYALDFAGGAVVHINSGVAGLVAALVIGKGLDYENRQSTPTNLVMSVLGAGLLWVGWFGFNAGSALTAGTGAGMAMLVTNTAAAMAGISWVAVEWLTKGKPSVAGALSGIVAGLVAITPASGFVGFEASIVIGLTAGAVCFWAAKELKHKLKYDDSLDVFGIHGVGGIVGALLTGIFATTAIGAGSGWVDGNTNQLIAQALSIVIVAAYSAIVTWIILKFIQAVCGLRVPAEVENSGLDLVLHGEELH